jgi:hypothetical protein
MRVLHLRGRRIAASVRGAPGTKNVLRWLGHQVTRRNTPSAPLWLATDNVAPRGAGKDEPASQLSSRTTCGSDTDARERQQRSTLRSDAETGTREDADDSVDPATNDGKTP